MRTSSAVFPSRTMPTRSGRAFGSRGLPLHALEGNTLVLEEVETLLSEAGSVRQGDCAVLGVTATQQRPSGCTPKRRPKASGGRRRTHSDGSSSRPRARARAGVECRPHPTRSPRRHRAVFATRFARSQGMKPPRGRVPAALAEWVAGSPALDTSSHPMEDLARLTSPSNRFIHSSTATDEQAACSPI